jgi:spermidine synthase
MDGWNEWACFFPFFFFSPYTHPPTHTQNNNTQQVLLLDGKAQSAEADERVYHEMLVHPALLSHPCPRRVFIAGGGEGATAREVLRHASVERLVMADIDAVVCDFCERHLPANTAAFADPRLELVIDCARARLEAAPDSSFDVIIGDLADPVSGGPCYQLYTREFYEGVIARKLAPGGIFVTQSGPAGVLSAGEVFAPIHHTLAAVFPRVVPLTAHVPSYADTWGWNIAFGEGVAEGGEGGGEGGSAAGALPSGDGPAAPSDLPASADAADAAIAARISGELTVRCLRKGVPGGSGRPCGGWSVRPPRPVYLFLFWRLFFLSARVNLSHTHSPSFPHFSLPASPLPLSLFPTPTHHSSWTAPPWSAPAPSTRSCGACWRTRATCTRWKRRASSMGRGLWEGTVGVRRRRRSEKGRRERGGVVVVV